MTAALIVLSAVIRTAGLDLATARLFFRPGESPPWWGANRPVLDFIYRFGGFPVFLVASAAVVIFAASLFRRGLRRHRRACVLLVLLLAIGPGILVNAIGKNQWGRPRPRNLIEFGGDRPFVPVGGPARFGGHSFPSGHASMGFYWLVLFVIWRNSRPRAARMGLAVGLLWGTTMSLQRITTGAHFLSDSIWAGGIDYLVALSLDTIPFRSTDTAAP